MEQLEKVLRDELVGRDEGTEFGATQGFQLLDDVWKVGGRDAPFPQQRSLLLRPGVEVTRSEWSSTLILGWAAMPIVLAAICNRNPFRCGGPRRRMPAFDADEAPPLLEVRPLWDLLHSLARPCRVDR